MLQQPSSKTHVAVDIKRLTEIDVGTQVPQTLRCPRPELWGAVEGVRSGLPIGSLYFLEVSCLCFGLYAKCLLLLLQTDDFSIALGFSEVSTDKRLRKSS